MQDVACRNVELKAVDLAPQRSAQVCLEIGASDQGVVWQRDTYFQVLRGRLKLREENPGSPHLIQFTRDDRPDPRPSDFRIASVEDVDALRSVLEASLEALVVVTKRRHLFLWHTVRIHLDLVDELGAFIELEAVARPDSDLAHDHELIGELRARLGITDESLVSSGYADQLKVRHQPGC